MIEIKNLSCTIDNKNIFDDISFCVQNGEILVITGTNGAGKTTLLKLISGIIPLQKGKIFIDGKDVSKLGISERAKNGLSYAFQHPVSFKGITVKDLLDIAQNTSSKISDACDYLSQVGLCARDYLDRFFDKKLSGGERKKIELAITLAKNSTNIIFDEPEAGIDMWSFENTCKLFSNLKKQNKAILIVSHNNNIIEIADKVLVFENGKLLPKNHENLVCPKLKGGLDE